MDESDLFRVLSRSPERTLAAQEFLKLAAPEVPPITGAQLSDLAKAFYTQNKTPILGAAIGAGTIAAAAYLASKKGKGGKSYTQKIVDPMHEASQQEEDIYRKGGGTPGFATRMKTIGTRATKDLAELYAAHPGKAAVTSALVGGMLGWKSAPTIMKMTQTLPEYLAWRK